MTAAQQLIDSLWDFNDPALSESRFREASEREVSIEVRLELRTQLARAQGLQGLFSEGHTTLDRIECERSGGRAENRLAISRVRCLLERGRLLNSAGDRLRALPCFEEALRISRELGNDHLAIDAAHMIAIVHGGEGRHDLALEVNRSALAMAEGSTQPRARQWLGSLHNNIGWTLHDRGEFQSAFEHFERALQWRIESKRPDDIRVARWCIARCLRSMSRFDDALSMQRKLELERAEAGLAEDGFVSEEIAECLLALGKPGEASSHFAKAFSSLSKLTSVAAVQPSRLGRLKQHST